jgi:hypothetical protein
MWKKISLEASVTCFNSEFDETQRYSGTKRNRQMCDEASVLVPAAVATDSLTTLQNVNWFKIPETTLARKGTKMGKLNTKLSNIKFPTCFGLKKVPSQE